MEAVAGSERCSTLCAAISAASRRCRRFPQRRWLKWHRREGRLVSSSIAVNAVIWRCRNGLGAHCWSIFVDRYRLGGNRWKIIWLARCVLSIFAGVRLATGWIERMKSHRSSRCAVRRRRAASPEIIRRSFSLGRFRVLRPDRAGQRRIRWRRRWRCRVDQVQSITGDLLPSVCPSALVQIGDDRCCVLVTVGSGALHDLAVPARRHGECVRGPRLAVRRNASAGWRKDSSQGRRSHSGRCDYPAVQPGIARQRQAVITIWLATGDFSAAALRSFHQRRIERRIEMAGQPRFGRPDAGFFDDGGTARPKMARMLCRKFCRS